MTSTQKNVETNPGLLEGLVCPDCKSPLIAKLENFYCSACRKSFPIKNGIPCFVELDPKALPFKEEYFDFWFERENTHFWHVVRREIIYNFMEPFLKRRSTPFKNIRGMEVGIGNGNVTKEFVEHGVMMEGSDLFYSSLQYCRKRMNIPLYQSDVLNLPFCEKFDFIGIYDIIEHLEDDRRALKNLYGALKAGGLLNITVPACKFLWSQFDELDHKRRYSRRELVEKVEEAGFKIHRVSFLMFLLFPVVYLVRKIQTYPKDTKLEHVSEVRVIPIINEIFLLIFRVERVLLKFFDLPIGSSLILVAEKPKT